MIKYTAFAIMFGVAVFAASAQHKDTPNRAGSTVSSASPAKIRDAISCADWTKYSGSQPDSPEKAIELSHQVWLIGYLSGLAAATETDIPTRVNNKELYAWMDNYCVAHPALMVSSGAGMVILGLKEKGSL